MLLLIIVGVVVVVIYFSCNVFTCSSVRLNTVQMQDVLDRISIWESEQDLFVVHAYYMYMADETIPVFKGIL